ncbi:TauD/TfdA family dioxygenase, partial [Pseudomonas aeruginosa]
TPSRRCATRTCSATDRPAGRARHGRRPDKEPA